MPATVTLTGGFILDNGMNAIAGYDRTHNTPRLAHGLHCVTNKLSYRCKDDGGIKKFRRLRIGVFGTNPSATASLAKSNTALCRVIGFPSLTPLLGSGVNSSSWYRGRISFIS
jgi:hypothetical protein